MKEFVLDCSVTMAWCFEEEACTYAYGVLEQARRARVIVPSLWHLEVINVLVMAERKKRLDAMRSNQFMDMLGSLPIETDTATHTVAFSKIGALARAYGLTAYDACYLEICVRRNLPLATLDKDLKKSAQAARVEIL